MNAQTENGPRVQLQRRLGAVLTTLVAVMLLGSASTKLAHMPSVVSQLAAAGIAGNRLIFVAALETLSAVLFLIPITRSAGLLLVSAFLGGAIATHLQHAQSIVLPSIILMLIWVGTWFRHPEILWSWHQGRSTGQTGELK